MTLKHLKLNSIKNLLFILKNEHIHNLNKSYIPLRAN